MAFLHDLFIARTERTFAELIVSVIELPGKKVLLQQLAFSGHAIFHGAAAVNFCGFVTGLSGNRGGQTVRQLRLAGNHMTLGIDIMCQAAAVFSGGNVRVAA